VIRAAAPRNFVKSKSQTRQGGTPSARRGAEDQQARAQEEEQFDLLEEDVAEENNEFE
jgi:hypothetical protein